MLKFFFIGILVTKSLVFAGEVNIAAAADLKFALADIVKAYESAHKDEHIKTTFGASGKLTTQIIEGAPFDIFFAANISYPEKLKAAGMTSGEIKPYAVGRLVIITKKGSGVDLKQGISILTSDKVKKIAIANPDVAPYGKAALEVLKNGNIYQKVENKIVKGENVQQAATFGVTGAADAAIVAHSLALQPTVANEVDSYLIDSKLHTKMVQAYSLTKKGGDNASAKKFIAFFEGKEGSVIMKKYGFAFE